MAVKKAATIRGTESRLQHWEEQAAEFEKMNFVFEQEFEVNQELLKDAAPRVLATLGVDLAKLTKSSRAAFERIGRRAKNFGVEEKAEGGKK